GLPVWVYDLWGCRIEKRICMPYKQNTVHIEYRYIQGSASLRLGLRPGMHLRNHDAPVDTESASKYVLNAQDYRLEISGGAEFPVLRLKSAPQTGFTYDPRSVTID